MHSREPHRLALKYVRSTDHELSNSSPQVCDSSQADPIIIRAVLVSHRKVLEPLHLIDRGLPNLSPQISGLSQADSTIIRVVLASYRKSLLWILTMFLICQYYTQFVA